MHIHVLFLAGKTIQDARKFLKHKEILRKWFYCVS